MLEEQLEEQLGEQLGEQQVGALVHIAYMSFDTFISGSVPFRVGVLTRLILTPTIKPYLHLTRSLQYETFSDITARTNLTLYSK